MCKAVRILVCFKMGMAVNAGAGIRGSEVLKNRGITHKRKDHKTFVKC